MKRSTTVQPVNARRFHTFRAAAFSTYFIPVAIVLAFCGLILESGGHHLIAALCFIGVSLALTGHSGFEIDTEQALQRFYFSYIGIRFGSWQPLRNYVRLGIRLCRRSTTNVGRSSLSTWKPVSFDFYKLFLFTGVQQEAICIGTAQNIEEANEKAARLAQALPGLEIIHN